MIFSFFIFRISIVISQHVYYVGRNFQEFAVNETYYITLEDSLRAAQLTGGIIYLQEKSLHNLNSSFTFSTFITIKTKLTLVNDLNDDNWEINSGALALIDFNGFLSFSNSVSKNETSGIAFTNILIIQSSKYSPYNSWIYLKPSTSLIFKVINLCELKYYIKASRE